MPMHPRPSAETVGPRRPSLRCCMRGPPRLVIWARLARRVQYGRAAVLLRSGCRRDRQTAAVRLRRWTFARRIERSRACYERHENSRRHGHGGAEALHAGASMNLQVPETILPSQFFDRLHTNAARHPEQRLMLAVLADEVTVFQRYAGGTTPRASRRFAEADEWFLSNEN